jgi:serine/threonine protein kinase
VVHEAPADDAAAAFALRHSHSSVARCSLSLPACLPCRWYDRSGQVLVFITELLTDGSLRRFIRRKHAAGITLSALKRYSWQILQGLVYLHGHYPPIIHRCVWFL